MPRKPTDCPPFGPVCRGAALGLLLSVPSFGLLADLIFCWRP